MSMKILAISCGHGINVSGKRCLKTIDKNETREWWLNNRVGVYVEEEFKEYDGIQVVRVDDTTGKTNVELATRRNKSNALPADAYLAIHHNAGINGGKGGGVVVYARSDKALATDFYNRVVGHNGLRGNRSNPIQIGTTLYEVREPKAYSILLENGFMDSTVDTPLILTDAYARNTAKGIVEFYVNLWGLKKKADRVIIEEPTQPSTTAYEAVKYIVKSGDTLAKIAKAYNTTVDEIMSLNPSISNPNKIYVKQEIIISVNEKTATYNFKVGDLVRLKDGATYYNGKSIPNWVFKSKLYYRGENKNGSIISTLKIGLITGTVDKKNILPY